MNKTLLAAGLSLAMTSTGAWALEGIQIDPTGTGTIGNSFIANGLGSDFGDALMKSLFNVAGGNSGTVYAHNVFDLGTLDPGELTFTLWMETDSSPTVTCAGGAGCPVTLTDPNNVIMTNPAGHDSYFALYYDPLTGGSVAANHDTGAGYDDGILLAEGLVSIDLDPGTGSSNFTVTLNTLSPLVPLDTEAGSVATADINGNIFLNVEFYNQPALGTYLINDLVTLDIDLEVNGGILTPYDAVLASDVVGGTTDADGAGPDVVGGTNAPGADAENDFTCTIVGNQETAISIFGALAADKDCDAQVQITTVLDFNADSVPEPTTLGLIGAGLGLAGYFSRRRKSAA